jgi:uncharacterized membrane protein YfhO
MSKAARLYLDYWKNILPWTLLLSAMIVLIKFIVVEFKPTEFELVITVMLGFTLAVAIGMFVFALQKLNAYQREVKHMFELNSRKALHPNSKADKVMHA